MAESDAAATRGRESSRWWVAAVGVLHAPRTVFEWLRDDSAEAAAERQEPVVALVFLAGVAGVLSTAAAGRLLDEPETDALALAAWAFIGGAAYGFLGYWLVGALLTLSARVFGSRSTRAQLRHVLAYALAPLGASLLLLWPLRIALHGGDLFRRGGDDTGMLDRAFDGVTLGVAGWAVALLLIGSRAIHGWSWSRAAASTFLALTAVAGLAAGLDVLG